MMSQGNSPTVSESVSTDEDIRRMNFGKCVCCGRTKTDETWCMRCSAKQFKKLQWESGSDVIDDFIRETQAKAINRYKSLEWIPYDNFSNVEFLAEGGYGVVHRAKWKGGFINYFDNKTQQWDRSGDIDVVLKSLRGPKENISREFLDEITLQLKSHDAHSNTIECYGITRDSKAEDFMMVMKFMKDGNLRNFLNKKFMSLGWTQKLEILFTAAKGLCDIHEAKLIHKDLHPGNIVVSGYEDLRPGNIVVSGHASFITDFGFCKPDLSDEVNNTKVFGVLPYIAPEILRGEKHTRAADIYAFGVIINEVTSGYPPYHDVPHDSLTLKIVFGGAHPEIDENITPKLIADLIRRCWNVEPENRPDAKELHGSLWSWHQHLTLKRSNEIRDQIEKIEKSQNYKRFLAAMSSNNNMPNTPNTPLSFNISFKSVEIPRVESISDSDTIDLVII